MCRSESQGYNLAVTVRPAEEGDLPEILAILNREILEGVAHFATEPQTLDDIRAVFLSAFPRFPWHVAADDESGELFGFARCNPWKSRGAYGWTIEVGVYVRPDLQGRGIGREIYREFIPALRKAGFRTVLAGIGQPNPASIRLHEAFGFKYIGTLPRAGWKKGKWHEVGYWALNFGGADEPPAEVFDEAAPSPD